MKQKLSKPFPGTLMDDARKIIEAARANAVRSVDYCRVQMYVNYYDRMEKLPEENPTIGILLCTGKNDTTVKMSLPEDNRTILASEYKLYLPTTEQLAKEIDEVRKRAMAEDEGM